MKITGKTKIVGIFGYPIEHTFSPSMHNAAFSALGLDYCYIPFEVRPQDLKSAVEGIRTLNIRGINITVPHKEAVIKYLDVLSKEAKLIGAVNTIENRNGKLIGHNTDGRGFIKSIWEDAGTKVKRKRILLLGAGGAGKGVAVSCALEGVSEIVIANRTVKKADELVGELKRNFKKTKFSAIPLERHELTKGIAGADILINATSIGLKGKGLLPISQKDLHRDLVIYDLIYNPQITPLLKIARRARVKKAANGIGMLIHQGALAFHIWTGKKPPVDVMKRAIL
ncbi:MAG: shikimate dehydrogenase [Nitrospirae bacterium]|nr:shikimate dehydrogenase [Nitrospirota bacterium]